MKRLFLFLAISLCGISMMASVYSGTCGANLSWTLDTSTDALVITGSGDMYDYTSATPSTAPWYSYRSQIRSVSFPIGLTSIGNYAFYGFSNITSVTLPNTIVRIGKHAFEGATEVVSLTLSNNITHIEEYAFYLDSKITSISLPNSLIEIGRYALYGPKISTITIPINVKKIGYSAIGHSDIPSEISVNWNAKNCSNFSQDSCFIISNMSSITFGNFVESIPSYLCYDNKKVTNITIPSNVTKIGYYAFKNSRISSVTILGNITSMGGYVFENCSNLSSVTLANGIKEIGHYAFAGCKRIQSIVIPSSVTEIGRGAFRNCEELSSIAIPNNVQKMGPGVFEGCTSITEPLYNSHLFIHLPNGWIGQYSIPSGTQTICGYAFYGCSELSGVIIPNSVDSIDEYAFYNCSRLSSLIIPNSVQNIADNAFKNCTNLSSVSIGNNVRTIGSYAFENCVRLSSITIPNSVTSIGQKAFYRCGVTSVTIGQGVTSIAAGAFKDTRINTITIPINVQYVGEGCFDGTQLSSVRWEAKRAYDFDRSPFYNIRQNINSFTFGDSVSHIPANLCRGMYYLTKLSIPNSVLSIGEQAFLDCWMQSLALGNHITDIGYGAFYNVHVGTGNTHLIIPNSVINIGSRAFWNISFASVTIGKNVSYLGDCAFDGSYTDEYIILPKTYPQTGSSVFTTHSHKWGTPKFYFSCKPSNYSGEWLASYDSNDNSMGVVQSNNCDLLTALPEPGYKFARWSDGNTDNPRNVEVESDTSFHAIFEQAYSGKCGTNLYWEWKGTQSATLHIYGEGLMHNYTEQNIPWILFRDKIKAISIEGASSIGNYAFAGCTALSSFVLPNSITKIGGNAFKGTKIKTIVALRANPPSIVSNTLNGIDTVKSVCATAYQSALYWRQKTNKWIIGYASANEQMGTVSSNDCDEIVAHPNAGYEFVAWNDGNTDNPRTIYPTEEITYTAMFQKIPTTLDNISASVKAEKQIIDGVLYIIRDGVRYTATGQRAE